MEVSPDKVKIVELRMSNETKMPLTVYVNRKLVDTLQPQGFAAYDYLEIIDLERPNSRFIVQGYESSTPKAKHPSAADVYMHCTEFWIGLKTRGQVYHLPLTQNVVYLEGRYHELDGPCKQS
jgi:hypothetical protein